MRVFVDASPLYNLGMIGETELLTALAGTVVVPEAVGEQVDVEPAATNLAEFLAEPDVEAGVADVETVLDDRKGEGEEEPLSQAVALLGDDEPTVDAVVIAGVLAERAIADGRPCCGVVSDDRRIRRLADGLGAGVTSTFGIVVRAALADKYFPTSQAKRVLRRLDGHGTVTTGPLREQAYGGLGE